MNVLQAAVNKYTEEFLATMQHTYPLLKTYTVPLYSEEVREIKTRDVQDRLKGLTF